MTETPQDCLIHDLVEATSGLLQNPDATAAISQALKKIGLALKASHVMLYQLENEQIHQRIAWVAPEPVTSARAGSDSFPFSPQWRDRLFAPKGAHPVVEPSPSGEAQTAWIVPIQVDDRPWGCLRLLWGSAAETPRGGEVCQSAIALLACLGSAIARRQQEVPLRESEERYRGIIESQQDLIIRLDLQGHFTFVNDAYCHFFGKRREELIGCIFLTLIHDEDLLKTLKTIEILQAPPYRLSLEQRVITAQGDRWIGWEKYAIRNPHGQVVEIQAVGRDITRAKLAEMRLSRLNEELEFKVQERTQELAQANWQLRRERTELRRTEAALRETNEALEVLIDSSPAAIITLDREGRVKTWNHAAQDIFGWTQAEVLAKPLPIVPPELARQGEDLFNQALQGEVFKNLELPRQRQDGSVIDVTLSTAPLKNEQGEIVGVMGVLTDITTRKQAELALQQLLQRERLLRSMQERIRRSLNLDEILETTVQEVRHSLQAERVLIYQIQGETSGAVVVESASLGASQSQSYEVLLPRIYHLHSDYGSPVWTINDIYRAGLTPAQIACLEQLQVKAKLVAPLWIGEASVSENSSGNRLWGLLMVHQCSTPRTWQMMEIDLLEQLAQRVAIAIQQSELYHNIQTLNLTLERQVQERTAQLQRALQFEAMLKRIADKVRDSLDENQIMQAAVAELALGLQVSGCNASLYDLQERTSTIYYEYAEGIPASLGRVAHLDKFRELYDQLLHGQYCQFCSIEPSPVRGWVAMLACPIFDDQGVLGDLWLVHQMDYAFSELEVRLVQQVANQCAIALRQAHLYQASQAQVQELQKLDRLKDEFMSSVQHELRTPMTNMKVALQMLKIELSRAGLVDRGAAVAPTKVEHYLKILQDEWQRELRLINDLLEWQRLDRNHAPLSLEPLALELCLSQAVERFQERATHRHQTLHLEQASHLPLVYTEPETLEGIISELLTNACKYTPPGERIAIAAVQKPQALEIRVTNFGVEIPENERSRIFERFYRIPDADPAQQGGTGLGLALVQKRVARLGGTIKVESQNHQTCFSVSLPL
ncbi:PAS domain S-box protein [Geitlerinema splendidum]|nr:PAS domain S-box protein [Geitlerinema splendidum]